MALVPFPSVADLTFFGSDLVASGAYPWNLLALAASLLFGLLTCALLAALGEAGLQRALRPLLGEGPAGEPQGDSLTGETAVTFVVILACLLPAAAATLALALALAAVAPGEFQSPDIGGPVLLRVVRDVAPLLVVLLVLVVAGQAVGSAAQRRAVGPRAEPIERALRHAAGDLRRRPGRVMATATVTLVATTALLALSTLLLRILWAPIGEGLRDGQLGSPQTVLLLVGFMAIWLCLLLAAGALHAWASAWWSLELPGAERRGHTGSEERDAP